MTMKTAHVNEAGINLRYGVGENLPSEAWEKMLDQLRSEHIPGQYPLGKRSILSPGLSPDITRMTIYFTPKMVTINEAKEILHHWGFEVYEAAESH
jgi:hypothetical protein